MDDASGSPVVGETYTTSPMPAATLSNIDAWGADGLRAVHGHRRGQVTMDKSKLERTLLKIFRWIVDGAYEDLVTFTNGYDLTVAMIEEAIETWPDKILIPPEEKLSGLIHVIEFDGSPKRWSVNCDCWTAEQGRADLTLVMTFTDSNDEFYNVMLNDIDVL